MRNLAPAGSASLRAAGADLFFSRPWWRCGDWHSSWTWLGRTAGGCPRVKSVRSHLSTADLARLAADGGHAAGPPPLPPAEPGAAIEVDRVASKDGLVSLGGRYNIAAEILGGQLVSIRIEASTLMLFGSQTVSCCAPGPAH